MRSIKLSSIFDPCAGLRNMAIMSFRSIVWSTPPLAADIDFRADAKGLAGDEPMRLTGLAAFDPNAVSCVAANAESLRRCVVAACEAINTFGPSTSKTELMSSFSHKRSCSSSRRWRCFIGETGKIELTSPTSICALLDIALAIDRLAAGDEDGAFCREAATGGARSPPIVLAFIGDPECTSGYISSLESI
jgi:hypothetical protein